MTDTTATQSGPAPTETSRPATKGTIDALKDHANGFVTDATEAARTAASEGKARASEALGTVTKVAENAANLIEDKVGPTYGAYARKAATGVSDFAGAIENKDIDELVDDARDFVRKSPLIAIGAAVAIGFALTRIARIGSDDMNDATAA